MADNEAETLTESALTFLPRLWQSDIYIPRSHDAAYACVLPAIHLTQYESLMKELQCDES